MTFALLSRLSLFAAATSSIPCAAAMAADVPAAPAAGPCKTTPSFPASTTTLPSDRSGLDDVSNLQAIVQKSDGAFEFDLQSGLYTLPVLGTATPRTIDGTRLLFAPVPVVYGEYAFDDAQTLTFDAGADLGRSAVNIFATPPARNDPAIFDLVYRCSQGPRTVAPDLQSTTVERDARFGRSQGASTYGGPVLASYASTEVFALAGRVGPALRAGLAGGLRHAHADLHLRPLRVARGPLAHRAPRHREGRRRDGPHGHGLRPLRRPHGPGPFPG